MAEILFGGVNIDEFFLEYNNERSGGFEPLRFIKPGHQKVVLGLVTTKNGELEDPAQVKARLQEERRSSSASTRSALAHSAASP